MTNPILRTRNSGYGGSGYSIPTEIVDGKPRNVVGVTTITGVTNKPALLQYYADAVAAKAVVSLEPLLNRTEEEGFKYLRYAGNYANKDAIQNGNIVHEWLEAHILGDFEPELENEQQEQMVVNFLKWKADHDIVPILTEATVYNSSEGYAGTLDWIWEIDGVPTLGDHKTGKGIYTEHKQQLAALGACNVLMKQVDADYPGAVSYTNKEFGETFWVEDVLPDFSQYAILHIRPDSYDSKGYDTEGFCELHVVEDWRIDIAYRGFLGAWELKKAERDEALEELKIKQREKEEVF